MTWTLADIRTKVRGVTGRYSISELSNSQLDDYINKYFQYTFPAEVKLDRNYTTYELFTIANKQSYDAPSGYENFVAPSTIDNQMIIWYQDWEYFNEENPQNIQKVTIGTGDGATLAFSSTTNIIPILPASIFITDDNETFQDTNTDYNNSPVTISGSDGGSATVNYSTGAISVTFNTAPADGQSIYATFINFVAGKPTAVLWNANQFTFYPVPDAAYRFKVGAYSLTTVVQSDGTQAALFQNSTDRPLIDQWGPAIAYGAARNIQADFGEMDAYAQTTQLYKEQVSYMLRKTNQNLLNLRAGPNF